MAKKLMIFPSARSRYLSDKGMNMMYKTLLVLAAFMVLQNWYLYSFMHGIKLVLMIVLSIIATRETEILFYSHDKDIDRAQSKELITKSYPEVTALLFALLIPVGTPLWLTVIGAILATVIGKLIFGGFHHMVFHTSLVGFLFVTLGWTGLSINAEFANSFDNYVLKLLFDNDFFNNTLSIGNAFLATDPLSLSSIGSYDLWRIILGLAPGVLGIGVVMIAMFGFLVYKKVINWITTTALLASMFVITFVVAAVNGYDLLIYPLEQIFGGMFLFVAIFLVSDPITTPIPKIGKVVYGIGVAALTVFIRQGDNFMNGTYVQGVVFAVLFMSMLTPMMNVEFGKKKKKKVVKKDPVPAKKVGA